MQEENPVLDIRLISGFLLVRINNEENKEEVKKVVDKSPKFVGGRWLELQDNLEMRRRGFVGKRGKIVSVDSEAKKATITLNHIHTGPIEVSYDDIKETW